MASLPLITLIFLLQLPLFLSSTLFLPLTKHPLTNQHFTQIQLHLLTTSLILDLNSPFTYLDCISSPKPTITSLHCRSIECTSASPNNPCSSSSSSTNQPCSVLLQNPITGLPATGDLVQGNISFNHQYPSVDSFLLFCAPKSLLSGLPSNVNGVFGLGRTRTGAISQISHFFDYPQRFSLCLSSTHGMISSGNEEIEVFKSMMYTPLLDIGDFSYSINLKSIKIQNKKVLLDGLLSSVKISTVDPYSKMETRVFEQFVKDFVEKGESLNLKRVAPQGGFEVCYGYADVVPVIDLVLQSEMVKWRIYGHNSMVKINDQVMCLGFLDGGLDLGSGVSMILGAHQIEDNLLEFDLVSSMVGFSSSLLKLQTSCSQLSLSAMYKSVQVL